MSVSTMHQGGLPELEEELEGEYEGEEFDLGGVISGLLGEGELEDEWEDEGEDELEDEWEGEYELEGEWEDEGEGMANPLRRVYPDAMMEHLGHAAAEAETEAEAEAFIGALVPLAAGLARKAAPLIARQTPQLVRGLSKVARTLRRNPTTRPLVRALPTIASRTTRSLARSAAHGRPITPRRAARTLAGQTRSVLASPHTRRQVIRRARALDRRYHHAARTGQGWAGAVPQRRRGPILAGAAVWQAGHRAWSGTACPYGTAVPSVQAPPVRAPAVRGTRPVRGTGTFQRGCWKPDARRSGSRTAGARPRIPASGRPWLAALHRLGSGAGLVRRPAAAWRLPVLARLSWPPSRARLARR